MLYSLYTMSTLTFDEYITSSPDRLKVLTEICGEGDGTDITQLNRTLNTRFLVFDEIRALVNGVITTEPSLQGTQEQIALREIQSVLYNYHTTNRTTAGPNFLATSRCFLSCSTM